MEKPVSFINKNNQRLYGILHIPERKSELEKRIAINLLNPGLKNRVAPNRLNVKLARMLCAMGYYVLRFDPFGIGDSQGELSKSNDSVMDLWGAIQRGLFVEDTIQSNNFLISETGAEILVLMGQCGAGVTAAITASRDNRVDHLILIDTPFRITSSHIAFSEALAETFDFNEFLRDSVRNFLKFDWKDKVLSKDMGLSLLVNKLRILWRLHGTKNRSGLKHPVSDRFNHALANSLNEFILKGHSIYFLFAEKDFSLKEFEQDFKPNFLENSSLPPQTFSIDITENANHIYTEIGWQDQLKQYIADWFVPIV